MPCRLILSLLLLACSPRDRVHAAAAGTPLRVGVSAVDISPQHPVRLSGYGFRREECSDVGHRIWAKALAIAGPGHELTLLITVDNVGVPGALTTELADRLQRRLQLPPDRLAVSASHTHTAPMLSGALPTLFGVPIPPEHQANIDRYTRFFVDRLEEAALAAARDLRPARLEWGIGRAGFAANRRTAGGPVDHDLPMLVVRGSDGKPRAIWFSYACHCTTLSNNKVSGDWAGWAQSDIEAAFPGAIALASIGCGADANPSARAGGDSTEFAEAHGRAIASEVVRLLGTSLEPITAAPTTSLDRFDLALAPSRTRAEWEERAKTDDAIGYHAKLNLARLGRGETIPAHIPYSVQTWRFGTQLALVFLPGEVVVDYSLRLKRELDSTRLAVIAYANAAPCYIPSERILKEGGYEGGGAMIYYDQPQVFASGLEEKIIGSVRRQIPAAFECPPGTEGIPARSPERSRLTFRTPPGLELQIVASEPMLASPITIDWDARGRMWVTEMCDYPAGVDGNWLPGGRIKVLEDTNRDGLPDRATVFVDHIPFPTGVKPWGNGALICAAPDILYAEDLDGDLKADRVTKLFSGFATENFQARVNSLALGLDNWIYGANGLLGGTIHGTFTPARIRPGTSAAPQIDVDIRNRDFRFHPFTGAFETAAGLTQQGRVRDDWGHWFGCDNSQAVTQYPLPEHYLRRNPHVPSPDPVHFVPTGPSPDRLFPASRLLARFNDLEMANRVTSACGIEIYRDDLLGAEYQGNAFVCENVHNLIHRQILSSDGIVFSGRRADDEQNSEFLASADNWSRPVQVRTGPDGALYVVDMYRFLIEHPRWIPAERLAQIDVRAGADRGRIYRLVPKAGKLRPIADLRKMSTARLAEHLDHPNGPERDRVHLELLMRGDKSALPRLTRLATSASRAEVRLQALCVLEGLNALTPDLVAKALQDPHEQVRCNAVRLAENWLSGTRPSADPRDVSRLANSVLALAEDNSRSVRYQVAFTLGVTRHPGAGVQLARIALQEPENDYLRAAVLSSAVPHAAAMLAEITAAERSSPGIDALLVALVTTSAAAGDPAALKHTLDSLLPRADRPVTSAGLAAFAGLLDALERRDIRLPSLLTGDAAPHDGTGRLRSLREAAVNLARTPTAPQADRELALRTFARDPSAQADDIELLATLVSTTPELRNAAIAALQRVRTPAVADQLLRDWPQHSPLTRSAIVTLLLSREEWLMPLLVAVKEGHVAAAEIPLSEQLRFARSAHEETRIFAREVLRATPISPREAVLADYRRALGRAGDPVRGREVFTRQCASCHSLDGVGFNVGPDLTTVGGKDEDYWLQNILAPSAAVVPQFVAYNIETKDGRNLSGVIQGESSTSLTLAQGGGAVETLLRSDIAELRASTLSLMPDGLEAGIPPASMADLLAFARRPSAPKVVPENKPVNITTAADGTLTLAASRKAALPPGFSADHVARTPAAVTSVILDPSRPKTERETIITANPQYCADLVRELTRDLAPGKEEYERIPWIWRVAIATGRRNDPIHLRKVLAVSLPEEKAPLRDWQAVVLGGGLINGLSERGLAPGRRLLEVIGDDGTLRARWLRALELASKMAEDTTVPTGTRYDALRMLGMESWGKCGQQIARHLKPGGHEELQMGAVSALVDVEEPEASKALIGALPGLTASNRDLALDSMLRGERQALALLEAIAGNEVKRADLGLERQRALRGHGSAAVQARAAAVLGAP
jgi:putative membrane-bound dehydrogenase-like protein